MFTIIDILLGGLDKPRLAERIHNELEKDFGVTSYLNTLPEAQADFLMKLCNAIAIGVIDEIQNNSKLTPVTQDAGSAGAGIITGFVE